MCEREREKEGDIHCACEFVRVRVCVCEEVFLMDWLSTQHLSLEQEIEVKYELLTSGQAKQQFRGHPKNAASTGPNIIKHLHWCNLLQNAGFYTFE